MEIIKQMMQEDHRRCDDLFAKTEELVANEQWDTARTTFSDFSDAFNHHLAMEEEVLFPEFEEQTESTAGPTQVMRSEHVQMRDLLSDMVIAIEQKDQDDYLGLSETLLVMMMQHNAKEENILYPATDQALAPQLPDILNRMNQVK